MNKMKKTSQPAGLVGGLSAILQKALDKARTDGCTINVWTRGPECKLLPSTDPKPVGYHLLSTIDP